MIRDPFIPEKYDNKVGTPKIILSHSHDGWASICKTFVNLSGLERNSDFSARVRFFRIKTWNPYFQMKPQYFEQNSRTNIFFKEMCLFVFFSLLLVTQIQIFELFNIIECCTNFFSSKKSTIEVNNSYKYTKINKNFKSRKIWK